MAQSKLCGTICLCKKSGNLIIGAELALNELRKQKKSPYLLLLAADASGNTRKRVQNGCAFYGRKLIELPIGAQELGRLVGKAGAVACVAVCDEGFARSIEKQASGDHGESNQREDPI